MRKVILVLYLPKMKEDCGGEVRHEIEVQLVYTSPVKKIMSKKCTNNNIHLLS